MSDKPRDLTLERVNRLTQAVADLMESNTALGRNLLRILEHQGGQLDRIEGGIQSLAKEMRALAGEQVLLGNRVENAFSRALRTNIRLDEIEDGQP
jgi:hypothetical protein